MKCLTRLISELIEFPEPCACSFMALTRSCDLFIASIAGMRNPRSEMQEPSSLQSGQPRIRFPTNAYALRSPRQLSSCGVSGSPCHTLTTALSDICVSISWWKSRFCMFSHILYHTFCFRNHPEVTHNLASFTNVSARIRILNTNDEEDVNPPISNPPCPVYVLFKSC